MDSFTDPRVETITLMKSARVGGTEAVNNCLGYAICEDPGPILMVNPTLDASRKYSKDILDPMIRDTPRLRGRVSEAKSRDRSNTILHKKFTGGTFYMVGANSPSSFRQMTIRYLVKDDFDGFPVSVASEGDPGRLANKRTLTFYNRKILNVSTPTVQGISLVETEWEQSNQSHYLVPCPHCGHFQKLIFSPRSVFGGLTQGFLKFDKDNLTWVHYECGNCHKPIEEHEKNDMVRAGRWEPSRPEREHHAGFHISQMYSPWSSWLTIAKEFIEAGNQREKIRTFVNVTLGETFKEDESIEFTGDSLASRREKYLETGEHRDIVIPDWVILCTAGVDVQHDRLEVVIKGWGEGDESTLIDRRIVYGPPSMPSTWEMLDQFLLTDRVHEPGFTVRYGQVGGLVAVGVDSGYAAEHVYQYVKSRMRHRFFAVKGDAGFDKGIVHRETFDKKIHARLVIAGVDTAKQVIYDRLKIDKPGPGYMHLNQRADDEYLEQLISERIVIKRIKGHPKKVWELPSGRRNEALDCEVYALVAKTVLRPRMDVLKLKLDEKLNSPATTEPERPTEKQTTRPQPQPKRMRRKIRGF